MNVQFFFFFFFFFFWGGGGGREFFYELTRDHNLTIFFFEGGEGKGRRRVSVRA